MYPPFINMESCPTEFLAVIFNLFDAGIAKAIFSFKCKNIFILWKRDISENLLSELYEK